MPVLVIAVEFTIVDTLNTFNLVISGAGGWADANVGGSFPQGGKSVRGGNSQMGAPSTRTAVCDGSLICISNF